MSIHGLHTLVGRAVVSENFCTDVLNGRRAQLICDYDLEPDEAAEVMAIQADSLVEFADAVHEIILARQPQPVPRWLDALYPATHSIVSRPNR